MHWMKVSENLVLCNLQNMIGKKNLQTISSNALFNFQRKRDGINVDV